MIWTLIIACITLITIMANYFTNSRVVEVRGGRMPHHNHRHDKITATNDNIRTFIVDTELMTTQQVQQLLPSWRPVTLRNIPAKVDFIFGINKASRRYYHVKTQLKNRMDSHHIWDKTLLHEIMTRNNGASHLADYIAATHLVDENSTMLDGAIWMIRANWGWKGLAAAVVTSTDELRAEIRRQQEAAQFAKSPVRIIASEYIRRPLLWRNYKFHVRMYFVAIKHRDNAQKDRVIMLRANCITPAKLPYVADNWQNRDIHDTHYDSNPLKGDLRRDNGDNWTGAALWKSAVDAFRDIWPVLLPYIKLYDEMQTGYELFGADVMWEEVLNLPPRIKILEINDNVGLVGFEGADFQELIDVIFGGPVADAFPSAYDVYRPSLDDTIVFSNPPQVLGGNSGAASNITIGPNNIALSGLIVCESTLLQVDVLRRLSGCIAHDDGRPVHFCWITRPVCNWRIEEATQQHNANITNAALKNVISAKSLQRICDKSQLYAAMCESDPTNASILPKTWPLETAKYHNETLICKDEASSLQADIYIATSADELAAIQHLPLFHGKSNGVAQELVANPLLWRDDDGALRKFHCRVYMFLSVGRGVFRADILDTCKIYTAAKPYDATSSDLDIVLTGGSRTARDYWWLRDNDRLGISPAEVATAWQNIRSTMTRTAIAISKSARKYPECQLCYHIVGADIILDKSLRAWLLEVNRRPSMLSINGDARNTCLATMIFREHLDKVIWPFFGLAAAPPDPLVVSGGESAAAELIARGLSIVQTAHHMNGASWDVFMDNKVIGRCAYDGDNVDVSGCPAELQLTIQKIAKFTIDAWQYPTTHARVMVRPNPPPPSSNHLTYYVVPPEDPSGANDLAIIDEVFEHKFGFTRLTSLSLDRAPLLIYSEPGSMIRGFGKSFNNATAAIKSALDNRDVICDKTLLHRHVDGKFLPEESQLLETAVIRSGQVLICKQRGSSQQQGVRVVTSESELDKAKLDFGRGIVQSYITNPLTSRGKKFHLRCYLCVTVVDGISRSYYAADCNKMLTSSRPYVSQDWLDPSIHISGGSTTSEWLEWPSDADCAPLDACTAQDNINAAMAALSAAICPVVHTFPESPAGFHVFGVDILIDTNMHAYILEVNDRPGFGVGKTIDPQRHDEFSRRYLTWLGRVSFAAMTCQSYAMTPLYCCPAAQPGSLGQYCAELSGKNTMRNLLRSSDKLWKARIAEEEIVPAEQERSDDPAKFSGVFRALYDSATALIEPLR